MNVRLYLGRWLMLFIIGLVTSGLTWGETTLGTETLVDDSDAEDNNSVDIGLLSGYDVREFVTIFLSTMPQSVNSFALANIQSGNLYTISRRIMVTNNLNTVCTTNCVIGKNVSYFLSSGSSNVKINGVDAAGTWGYLAMTEADASTMIISFTYDSVAYTLTLEKAANTVSINAKWVKNDTPVANAGADQNDISSGAPVTLDGSGSTDTDNDTLTYKWAQTSGTSVTLSTNNSTSSDKPSFTAPTLNVGDADVTLTFSLVVNDGTVDSSADTTSVTVKAPTVAEAGCIGLTGNTQSISNGSTSLSVSNNTNFGSATADGGILSNEFLIQNGCGSDQQVTSVVVNETSSTSNSFSDWLKHFSWWRVIGINDALAVGASDFAVITVTPFTINNNSSETFTINFTPTAVGLRDGVVVLTFSDNSTFTFVISGNGTMATLQNIPVFGPLGLLTMLLGLFWFGNIRFKG